MKKDLRNSVELDGKGKPRKQAIVWLAIFWLLLPTLVFFSWCATTTFDNKIANWLPAESAERKSYQGFGISFDSTESLVVAWPDCRIGSELLDEIERSLAENKKGWFQVVSSGSSTDRILGQELGLSKSVRTKRMDGFSSFDEQRNTALVLKLTLEGTKNREQVVQDVKHTLLEHGVAESSVRLGGSSYFLQQLDEEGFWSPLRVVPWIVGVAFLLCWALLGQLKLTFFINQIAILAASFSVAIVYFLGTPLNLILWPLPTLIMLLTSSTALHFLAYYRESVALVGEEAAPEEALKKFTKPALLCCLTTCIGLSSLMTSSILPIFQFGMFGAISICFSSFAVYFWLPKWLKLFPYKRNTSTERNLNGRWYQWTKTCVRFRIPILSFVLLSLLVLGWYLPYMTTGASAEFMFRPESEYSQSQQWLANRSGAENMTHVKLDFENADSANDRNRMRLLLKLQYQFKDWEEIDGANSAGIYSPKSRKRNDSLIGVFEKVTLENSIQDVKKELIKSGLVATNSDTGTESWLLSLKGEKYGFEKQNELVARIHSHVESEFSKHGERFFKDETLSVSSTSMQVMFNYLGRCFLSELVVTYCTAFCIISAVFLVVFTSWKYLLVSLIPNLLPVVAVLGGVAILGIRLDVGSLITASIALGIAVDDTLHFLLWWRAKKKEGMHSEMATENALHHCGTAMMQTTLVFGVGVSLYCISGFLPTARFGLLLSGMMLFAIIGDLVVIPALLGTRLGRS